MIQSMEILQLSIMALQERIEQEMAENPLLEIQEADPTLPDETVERDNPDAPSEGEKELVVDAKSDNAADFERLVDLDREVPDYFDETPRRSANRIAEDEERKHDAMANIVTRPESLNDYLLHQIGELDLAPAVAAMWMEAATCFYKGGHFRQSLDAMVRTSKDRPQYSAVCQRALRIAREHGAFDLAL